MKMHKLSVYMITFNEEKRLEKTLQAASRVADEIIIIDSGSRDKTGEIARKYGAKFYYHDWHSYAAQKNYAQSKCANEWLLSLDADEVLSEGLIREINQIKSEQYPQFNVYKIKIGEMFPGFQKPRPGTKKYNLERLYHRDYADMPADRMTKDRLVLKQGAAVGQLKGTIYHYSYLSLSHQVSKLNHFTDQVLQTAVAENKKYGQIRLATEFFRQFICYYIIKRNFLNGRWGFVSSVNHAYFRFLKIAKWVEYQNTNKETK